METINLKKFFLLVEKLKTTKRRGWTVKSTVNDIESVADHSYAASTIAMVLSDTMNLNTEKILKMMLLHDLPESIIGDLMPGENPNKSKEEDNAMNNIMTNLPYHVRKEYLEIWNEFKNNKSEESRFAHEIDKLELIIQLFLYKEHISEDVLKEFLHSSKVKINSELNKKVLKEIIGELE